MQTESEKDRKGKKQRRRVRTAFYLFLSFLSLSHQREAMSDKRLEEVSDLRVTRSREETCFFGRNEKSITVDRWLSQGDDALFRSRDGGGRWLLLLLL